MAKHKEVTTMHKKEPHYGLFDNLMKKRVLHCVAFFILQAMTGPRRMLFCFPTSAY